MKYLLSEDLALMNTLLQFSTHQSDSLNALFSPKYAHNRKPLRRLRRCQAFLANKSFYQSESQYRNLKVTRRKPCRFDFATHASESDSTLDRREPEDVRGAIAIGLSLYESGNYQEALEVFEKGLELPGSGMKRFR